MQLSMDGRTVTYKVLGEGADAIIFIPALGTTREMWKPQIPYFERDYTLVLYDPAGHEASAASQAGLSLATLADDLARLADRVGARRPHVVGISMGGMIAQECAIKHRERVQSLVLVCTTPSYPEESRRQIEQRAQTAEREGMAPLVEPTLERWFTAEFRAAHRDTVAWVRHMLTTADPHAYAAAARAVSQVNTTDRLHTIAAPTLVLTAEFDRSMPPDAATLLTDHIPDARHKAIADAAHLCNVANADGFNREVAQFIQGVVDATPGEAGVPGLPR
jgi:3-oxoadipate enol-lactonase